MAALQAVAHLPTDATTVLQSLLITASCPTIVLVCTTQAEFLRELLYSSNTGSPPEGLLRPTLHARSIAPHISMVFVPTVSHLRAWLTVADKSSFAPAPPYHTYNVSKDIPNTGRIFKKAGRPDGRLVVWNLVRASCHTSEWSVQGLSETLAALVECGQRLNCSIALAEAVKTPALADNMMDHTRDEEDEVMHDIQTDGGNLHTGSQHGDQAEAPVTLPVQPDIYHKRLPMLNGSSRRSGLDDSAAWSGRTVEVGVVLRRWFRFSSTGL